MKGEAILDLMVDVYIARIKQNIEDKLYILEKRKWLIDEYMNRGVMISYKDQSNFLNEEQRECLTCENAELSTGSTNRHIQHIERFSNSIQTFSDFMKE